MRHEQLRLGDVSEPSRKALPGYPAHETRADGKPCGGMLLLPGQAGASEEGHQVFCLRERRVIEGGAELHARVAAAAAAEGYKPRETAPALTPGALTAGERMAVWQAGRGRRYQYMQDARPIDYKRAEDRGLLLGETVTEERWVDGKVVKCKRRVYSLTPAGEALLRVMLAPGDASP